MLSAMDIFLLMELQVLFFYFLWEPLQLIWTSVCRTCTGQEQQQQQQQKAFLTKLCS